MNRILLGAAALAIAVPALAQIQPQAPMAPMAPMAPRMDVTQTRDQVVARVRDHFARMDTNRDGFVAGDEVRSMRGQRQAMNHGGHRMAPGGAGRDPAKAFDRIDTNRDGAISRDEFAKGHQIRIERKVVINGAPGAPGAPGAGDHRGMRKMHRMGGMGGGMMKMADLDKDGRVSLQEATTSALQRFDKVDTNRDGRITPEERRSMHQKMMQMRAPKAG